MRVGRSDRKETGGVRFSIAYAKRLPGLLPKEKEYAELKIARCNSLWREGR